MNYLAIIQYLYPTAIQGTDFYLFFPQGSMTPTISYWNTTKLGTQPTIAQLQQAWPSVQLVQAQQAQLTLLSNNAQSAITGGFSSSALGTAHTYPSQITDQLNLHTATAASTLPGVSSTYTASLWCETPAVAATSTTAAVPASWAYTSHTAAQVQTVFTALQAWVQAQQTTHAGLIAQVNAATTVAAVQAVVWP